MHLLVRVVFLSVFCLCVPVHPPPTPRAKISGCIPTPGSLPLCLLLAWVSVNALFGCLYLSIAVCGSFCLGLYVFLGFVCASPLCVLVCVSMSECVCAFCRRLCFLAISVCECRSGTCLCLSLARWMCILVCDLSFCRGVCVRARTHKGTRLPRSLRVCMSESLRVSTMPVAVCLSLLAVSVRVGGSEHG